MSASIVSDGSKPLTVTEPPPPPPPPPSSKGTSERRRQQQRCRSRSFWYCFAAFQLSLGATVAPLCWLVLSLTGARPSPPLGAAPAVIVTSVGAGLCLVSVALLCAAQCFGGVGCLASLLWLRIFTAGAGVCAHLAAAGLLLHAASQLLTEVQAAVYMAALSGLTAVNVAMAAVACVHIYNCVTAVRLSWRVAADEDSRSDAAADEEELEDSA